MNTPTTKLGKLRDLRAMDIHARYRRDCELAAQRRDEELRLLADLSMQVSGLIVEALGVRAGRAPH